MIKFEYDFDPDKIMKDILGQTKSDCLKEDYDVECPHCGKTFKAVAGKNVCPNCDSEVLLNLEFDF